MKAYNRSYYDKRSSNNINDSADSQTHLGRRFTGLIRRKDASSPDKQSDNRTSVRNIEEDGTRCDVSTKGDGRTQVEKSKTEIEDVAEHDCADRYVKLGLQMRKESVADNTLVAGHGPEKTTGAGNTGGCAVDEADA